MATSADYSRARSILKLLLQCESQSASPRATSPQGIPHEHSFVSPMAALKAMQDWKLDVHHALRRAGTVGGTILVLRTTRQQNSQANSYLTIAREAGLNESDTKLMFEAALHTFLAEIDRRHIPDAYWIRAEDFSSERCAAIESNGACSLVA